MPALTWWEQLIIQIATAFLSGLIPKVTDPVKKAKLQATVTQLKEHEVDFKASSAS